ncbi:MULTISPECIES: hypothetical protein [unclassified Mesorhizobium]|uniref:hypothetical protein n=1 Tax=unclassified Mesorhizobium TaxID=325217 RepID=UPI001CC9EA8B|nr:MULTISPECIES: hypothetical protein [unclassified Mesorhizobium]MBZ9673132.1 hypothetical protein [Mesorhizobium sp. ES1-3]
MILVADMHHPIDVSAIERSAGVVMGLIHAAGVSPSHAPIEAILKVALVPPSRWRNSVT